MENLINEVTRNAKKATEKIKASNEKNQVVGAIKKEDDLQEEGMYLAIVENANFLEDIPTKYGLADALDIEFAIYQKNNDYGSIEKTNFKERYFMSPRVYSPYYRHIREILDRDPREGFKTNELIGKVLEIKIAHNKSEDGTRVYANIETVRVIDMEKIMEVI